MIALYHGVSLPSRVIRWFTRSTYSHAAWVDPLTAEVIESWDGRVRRAADFGELHTPGTVVDIFEVEGEHVEMAYDVVKGFLERQVGDRYDWVGILHFGTRHREYGWQRDKWFCSELVYEAYRRADINLLERCTAHQVAPGHLAWSPKLSLWRKCIVPPKAVAKGRG